jgi:hypothetical protein
MFLGRNRVSNMSPTMTDLNNSECAKHQILAEKQHIKSYIKADENLPESNAKASNN